MSASRPNLPKALRRALAALERRELARRLWMGIGKSLSLWVGLILALYALDRLLVLPKVVRLLLLFAAFLWGSRLTYRFLWLPLRKRPSQSDLARRYERTHPELQDCFSTAVDFANCVGNASPDLVAAATQQANSIAPDVAPRRAVQMRRARRSLWLGFASMAAFILSAVMAPSEGSIFLNRFTGGETPWPSATTLRLLAVHIQGQEEPLMPVEGLPGQFRLSLPAGSEPLIRIRAEGVIPERINLRGLKRPRPVRGSGGGLFRLRLAPIHESMQISFAGGDDDDGLPMLILSPVEAPRVLDWSWAVTPPTYTEEPAFSGHSHAIRAPAGSTCEIRFRTSPSGSQTWVVQGEMTSPIPPDSEGWLSHSFTLNEPGQLDIAVQGDHDFRDPRAASLTWEVIPDRPPLVRFLYPPTDWSLVPGGEIPLVMQVRDDRRLTEVHLQSLGEAPAAISIDLLPLSTAESAGGQNREGTIFLAQPVLSQETMTLRLQLSARDSAPRAELDSDSAYSKTTSPFWNLQTPESYERHFASRMSHIRVALEGALEISRALEENLPDSEARKEWRRLSRQFDTIIAQSESLFVERVFTPIDPLVAPTRTLLADLLRIGAPAPGAVGQALASSVTRPGGRSGMLAEIVLALVDLRQQPQAQWRGGLEAILETLLAWEDFQGAIDLLRELVQRQQNILIRTQEASGR